MSTEEPGLDLERERIELETGLNEGSIPLFGDPDGAPFAPNPFLESLASLGPCARRYALARAHVLPWRDIDEALPSCYQHELERATFDVEEEYGSIDELDIKIDRLIEVYPSPVSEVVLRRSIDSDSSPFHARIRVLDGMGGRTPRRRRFGSTRIQVRCRRPYRRVSRPERSEALVVGRNQLRLFRFSGHRCGPGEPGLWS